MIRSLLAGVLLVVASPALHSETLDEVLGRYRAGEKVSVDSDTAKRYLGESYSGNAEEIYLASVKLAIVDYKDHGGWPYRSELLYRDPKKLYYALEAANEKKPDAIYLCAMICPALASGKQDEATDLLKKLRDKDKVLAKFAEKHFDYWKKSIAEAPSVQKAAADHEAAEKAAADKAAAEKNAGPKAVDPKEK